MPEPERPPSSTVVVPLLMLAGLAVAVIVGKNRPPPRQDRGAPANAGGAISSPAERQAPASLPTAGSGAPVNDEKSDGLAAKFAHWLVLYAAYLFLAGWTYLDHYFAVFGISARSLEFGLNDTVTRGFTVLFDQGRLLSFIYLTVLAISFLVEFRIPARSRAINTIVAVALIVMLVPTYLVSRTAGVQAANRDRSGATRLATITFTQGHCDYRGKLVDLKSELLFVYNLAKVTGPISPDKPCPIEPLAESKVPPLWLIRSDAVSDARIIHYAQEAIP